MILFDSIDLIKAPCKSSQGAFYFRTKNMNKQVN